MNTKNPLLNLAIAGLLLAAPLSVPLSAPLSAQSREIAKTIRNLNGSSFLLYVGKPSDPMHGALQGLARAEELRDVGLIFGAPPADSYNYGLMLNGLGLAPGSSWALTDGKGRCLMQGSELPTAQGLRKALDEAGVKNPVTTTRDFLKQHPGHLEAMGHLLQLLRKNAESRTKQTLKIDMTSASEQLELQNDASGLLRQRYIGANADASLLEGKTLEPEDDDAIWGPYAKELDQLFANDDWRLLIDSLDISSQTPVDACSPLMAQAYRRIIPKIEAYLEEFPYNRNMWARYAWMLSVAKQQSARKLYERIVPPPIGPWPMPQALGLLVAEDRASGNWVRLAETMTADWRKSLRRCP